MTSLTSYLNPTAANLEHQGINNGAGMNAINPGYAQQVRSAYLAASPSEQQAFAAQLMPVTTGGPLNNGVGSQNYINNDVINAAMGNPGGHTGALGALEAVGFGLAPLGFAAASAAAAGGAGADIAGSAGSDALIGNSGSDALSAGGNIANIGSNAFTPSGSGFGGGLGADFGSAGTAGTASQVSDLSGPAGDFMGLGGGTATVSAPSSSFISPSDLAQGLKGFSGGNSGGSMDNSAAPMASPMPQAAPARQAMGPSQPSEQLQPYIGAPAYQPYQQPSSTQQMMAAALGQNVQNAQRPAPVPIGFGLNPNPQTYGLGR